MQYSTGKHCVFYHRYHIVWSTKYRYKVLTGPLRLRVRDICRQVCRENEVDILRGVLSSDHVHMFGLLCLEVRTGFPAPDLFDLCAHSGLCLSDVSTLGTDLRI